MKRHSKWIMVPVLGTAFVFGTGLGVSARETVGLKDAVKKVVDQRAERMGGEDAVTAEALAADTTGVGTGMLDEILLSPDPYYYESLGRRDPFVSMVAERGEEDTDRVGKDSITVVGILWGDHDKFALVETADGTSAILRQGDHFKNATVTRINPDGIVLYVDNYGIGQSIRVPLTEGKGSNNARGRGER